MIDRLGGDIDAWTSAETMALSVQTTQDALPEALGILRDALLEPSFDPDDVALELQVARAEQQLNRDDPIEVVNEAILTAAWGDHPLSRPIIGTPSGLEALDPETLREHHKTRLILPERIIVGLVGDVEPSVLEEGLEGLPLGKELIRPHLRSPSWEGKTLDICRPSSEQAHIRLAFPGRPADDEDAVLISVLCRILGGGNSSRLFQRLREDRGICYDIWASPVFRSPAGLIEIGWACSPEHLSESRALVLEEIRKLAESLSDEETEVAIEGMRRSLVMEAETAAGRAGLDIAEVLDRGRRFELSGALQELKAVTRTRLIGAAEVFLDLSKMASATCHG